MNKIYEIVAAETTPTFWLWDQGDPSNVRAATGVGHTDSVPFEKFTSWLRPDGNIVRVEILGESMWVPRAPLALMESRIRWYALGCPGMYPVSS